MPDFVGKKDHTPFGSFSAELVYGEREDGSYVHISQVERGLACKCVCPACNVRLVANKGAIKTHYFSHYGKDSGCSSAAETNAHLWAKDILARELKLAIPAVGAVVKGRRKVRSKARIFHFVSAQLERRTGSIVPDVILTAKNGRELIVEVYVTHRCDDEKKEKLRVLGIAAVEIDLSSCCYVQDEQIIAERLLGASPLTSSNRAWLYNPVLEELKEEIAAELRREAEVAAVRADQRALALLAAARELPVDPDSPEIEASLQIADEFGCGGTVGLMSAEGRGFAVPTRYWQAALFQRVVMHRPQNHWSEPAVTVGRSMAAIRDCLLPAFVASIPADVRTAARNRETSFVFPEEAVEKYLQELLIRGVLDMHHWSEELVVSQAERQRLENRQREINAAITRLKDARERVSAIINRLPEVERAGFDLDAWCDLPFGDHALPLEAIASTGGAEWTAFEKRLSSVESIFWAYRHGRSYPTDLLCLPLDAEITRIEERARKKAEDDEQARIAAEQLAARRRVESLTNEAYRVLGYLGAPTWLKSVPAGFTASYEVLSAESKQGHADGYSALRDLREEHLAAQRREGIAAACRRQLTQAANGSYDPARVSLFLHNFDRDLGCSPMDYCTNNTRLQRCLAILAKQTGQTVKRVARAW